MTSSYIASPNDQPTIRVVPPADDTYGDLAITLASDYGLRPFPWQENVLNDWMSRRNGRWAALRCGLAVPRQNGKNGVLEMREIFGMIGRGERILHTAHLVKTAAKHFRRLQEFFGRKVNDPNALYPELNALVREIRSVNGQEAIYLKDVCVRCNATRDLCECPTNVREFRSGGSIEIASRSRGAGRGYTVDTLVFDEAQELDEDELEALMPTISAAPLGDPQMIFTGTPPGPNVSGEVWERLHQNALDNPQGFCWDEWSVSEIGDVKDMKRWYRVNPSLGRMLSLEVVIGEVETMSPEGFARERLGRWSNNATASPVNAHLWETLVNDAPPPLNAKPDALGIDASHDRTIAIAAAWQQGDGGPVHVELVALDQTSDPLGAAEWIRQRAGKRMPVVIDGKSPAASLIPSLLRARVNVIVTSAPDMGKACEMILQDTEFHRLRHRGQPQLDAAVAGLRKRPIGDAGMFGWDRRDPEVNISPAVAMTLARFGVTKRKRSSSNPSRGTGRGREAALLA